MKKLLLVLLYTLPLIIFTSMQKSNYCEGWFAGYPQGYCYDEPYNCIPPPTPICPIPDIGRNTYEDGYQDGFMKGKEDSE